MIDWKRVQALKEELGADDFLPVVELFLDELEGIVMRLAHGDAERLECDMHFLHGSAASLGFTAFASLCQQAEQPPVGPAGGGRDHLRRQRRRCCPSAEDRWEELLQLGAHGRNCRVPAARFQNEQTCDERANLVGVQQQGRDLDAWHQSIGAAGPGCGPDVVPEGSQPGDVATEGACCDVEALRELWGGPGTPGLQEREQQQGARCRTLHSTIVARKEDGLRPDLQLPSLRETP